MLDELTKKQRYILIKENYWKAIKSGKAYNAKIKAPNGVEIDISFIKGEIEVVYEKNIIPILNCANIHIFSEKDLLRIYKKFGKRNPEQNDLKVKLLKSKLGYSS